MAALKWVAAWAILAGLALERSAWGAHPLQTEDAWTQGAGNVELENGLSWARAADAKVYTYEPQVSYGLSPALDLIVQPSWISSRDEGGHAVRGWGDTNLDAKWRFHEAARLSLAVRAGATLATSQRGLGLPHGKVSTHALLAATFSAMPFTFHGNLGLTRNAGVVGEREHVVRVSSAVMWAASERLTLTADASAASDPDASRSTWPGTVLLGAIYTIRPGLDVDIGCQSSVRAAVTRREWLIGLTWRFTP